MERFPLSVRCSFLLLLLVSSKDSHQQLRKEILDLLRQGSDDPSRQSPDADVMIYPTFQEEAMNLTTDYNSFINILQHANRYDDLEMFITSGYVNFPSEVVDLLSSFKGKSSYLFAAPQANSFFHDPGFASIIPALYNIVSIDVW